MRRVILLISLLFSFSAFAQTYSELAQVNIAKQYNKVVSGLEIINDKAIPYDGKGIRKDIGKLKIYLDVFQSAYAPVSEKDLLLEIRDELDLGYEVVGKFKDLNDTMDADEVNDELLSLRRSNAIKWKEEFLASSNKKNYLLYLSSPLVNEVYLRDEKELPKFFWGIVEFPTNKISSGEEIISTLLNGMLKTSAKRYKQIMKFENLFKHSDEEDFHDFRKLIRAHLKLVKVFFEEKTIQGSEFFENYSKLNLMIDKFGDINDKLVGLHHAKSDKKKKKLKKKIRIAWYLLKAWCLENNISKTLKEFKL